MRYRRALQLVAVSVIVLCAFYALLVPKRGKVIDSWQTGNEVFNVRVTAHSERPTLPGLGGAFYVFESAAAGSDVWREALVFRHDSPVEVPRTQVRFVGDRVAYVFMGWTYAVTTDAGASWSVWDAEKDLPGWRCCDYNLIQDVRLGPSGAGTMRIETAPQQPGWVAELETTDYGRHWTVR